MQMVRSGYTTESAAMKSFDLYWVEHDMTRKDESSAYIGRIDRAPYFSEYVRHEIDGRLQPGSAFKPLYYSAAISSKKLTPSSLIYNSPSETGNPLLDD